MKIIAFAAAALVAASGLSATVAQAQTQTRTVVTTHREVHTHTGPSLGRHQTRRTCRTDIRHGHRVRTCRTVRY